MAFQWVKFKCLLVLAAVILILVILMEDKHEDLNDSNVTVENSYMKKLNRLRKSVGAIPVQYVAVAELTVPLSFSQDYIKGFINQLGVPISLQNSTDIIDVNITAVCQQSLTGVQCVCQNQYVWAHNNCLTYPACDSLYAGACGCISAKPTGQMCIPRSELPTFNFTIRIDVNADATLINLVKSYLQSPVYSPYPVSTIMEVSKVDLTTECHLNSGGYQCKCGDQYFWPCDTCFSYGYCDNNATCGCINGFPTDGQFCQPMTELMNATACDSATSTPSPTTAEISTLSPTTAGTSTLSTTTTAITPTPPTTTPTTSPTLPTTTPTQTSTSTSTPTPTSTPAPIPTTPVNLKSMAITVDTPFAFDLTDPTTTIFQQYQSKFKTLIDTSFQFVKGYVSNSAVVNKFRPGSVIADFNFKTTVDAFDFTTANSNLTSTFQSGGYPVKSVTQSDEGGLCNQIIYPLQNTTLTCTKITQPSWTKNGNLLSNQKDKYSISGNTLTLLNADPSDSGRYACSGASGGIPYENWQQIQIQPKPNIQVTNNKNLVCDNMNVTLQCSESNSYSLKWSTDSSPSCTNQGVGSISCTYAIEKAKCQSQSQTTATCQLNLPQLMGFSYSSKTIQINYINQEYASGCNDPTTYGAGSNGIEIMVPCGENLVGNITVKCENGQWQNKSKSCVPKIIADLKTAAQNLQEQDVGNFVANLSNAASSNAALITDSTEAIIDIASILSTIANTIKTIPVNKPIMTYFLTTMDIIGSGQTNGSWTALNNDPKNQNMSSELLKSVETMGMKLSNDSIEIKTNTSHLLRTNISQPFHENFGENSTEIDIPAASKLTFITAIVFSALKNVLPVRTSTMSINESSKAGVIINGDVAAVIVDKNINNISLTFDIQNVSGNPQCVFWNFNLSGGIGGWDSTGCEVKTDVNNTGQVTCECNHTTSFSILMSPFVLNSIILDFITYIGVGISMICLILSLIIEGIIWKSMTRNDTSYMRHVCIVNIALSLLIADICFIIGAGIVEKGQVAPVGPCSTATFFMHFFYLSLFFWMLLSALLLLYRTVVVFAGMSRAKMMIIAFTVGYGAPLLIAVITVAATAGRQGYIVEMSACWLNWDKTRAFLAFVVPALTIVVINLVVLAVVLYKMLRRGVGATTQPEEKHALVVIARCVAILTPLFGLTWGFGIGTMVSGELGIHIVFAILNSLQGFFILVFAILLDNKIREELTGKLRIRNFSSNHTRTTSAGPSSSSGTGFIERFRRRNIYHVADSSGFTADSSHSNSYTFTNT